MRDGSGAEERMAQKQKKSAVLDLKDPLAAMKSSDREATATGPAPPPLPASAGKSSGSSKDKAEKKAAFVPPKLNKAPPPILKSQKKQAKKVAEPPSSVKTSPVKATKSASAPSSSKKATSKSQTASQKPPPPRAPAISMAPAPSSISQPTPKKGDGDKERLSRVKALQDKDGAPGDKEERVSQKKEERVPNHKGAPHDKGRVPHDEGRVPHDEGRVPHDKDNVSQEADDNQAPPRRVSRRRAAGPVRGRIAANDDAPSIGGLIYALDQKPSNKPFRYAMIASAMWLVAGLAFASLIFASRMSAGASFGTVFGEPIAFLVLTAIIVPVAVIWFLALLAWRCERGSLPDSLKPLVGVYLDQLPVEPLHGDAFEFYPQGAGERIRWQCIAWPGCIFQLPADAPLLLAPRPMPGSGSPRIRYMITQPVVGLPYPIPVNSTK